MPFFAIFVVIKIFATPPSLQIQRKPLKGRINMKSLGIVRKLDHAGRFVMPVSLRRTLGLDKGDGAVEIFVDGDTVMLRRYCPSCIFCKSTENLIDFNDTGVCNECAKKLGELAK